MSNKMYLGDSVYASFDGYHVILTTENGRPDDPSNKIALEPSVLQSLNLYYKRITQREEKHGESNSEN